MIKLWKKFWFICVHFNGVRVLKLRKIDQKSYKIPEKSIFQEVYSSSKYSGRFILSVSSKYYAMQFCSKIVARQDQNVIKINGY